MNKLKRLAKSCEANEAAARTKAKQYIKAANVDIARVHAETALRQRHLARHYHTLVANLMPFECELKEQFSQGANSGTVSQQTQAILRDLSQMRDADNDAARIDVSPHHISTIINELSEETQLDMLNKLPSHQQLEERLRNLR